MATALPASAHGIGGDAATSSVGGFVGIGIEHMLLGWDHLLFVAGVVLLAADPRRGAKTITAFVLGHSLTLIVATLAGWKVSPTLVDVVIVLSVAFVGAYGILGKPFGWDLFTAIVFGFGLVHGLGLSTRFQALGVPEDGMVWRLIAFNVGIEIGQLTAIVAILAVAGVVSSMIFSGKHDSALSTAAFVVLFNVAAIAAPVLAYQGFTEVGPSDGNLDVALPEGSQCTIAERTETFPAAGGGHTDKAFYEPDEELPIASFGHSLADGYVIVLYADNIPEGDVSALREFVTSDDPRGVLAGARATEDQSESGSGTEVVAVTANHQMTCQEIDVGALRQFSRAWMDSIGATA
ncbi:HupE/UreJ family protein [Nocardioides aquiterrae]|uniref:HupE/UreJ family protein n=1 Tax=Nocardioides aquiterrae TaxID=203799 RepID=UPI0031D887B5